MYGYGIRQGASLTGTDNGMERGRGVLSVQSLMLSNLRAGTQIILCGAHLKNVNPLSVKNKPGSVRENWDLISNHPLKNKIAVCWGCVWKP